MIKREIGGVPLNGMIPLTNGKIESAGSETLLVEVVPVSIPKVLAP